MPTFALQNAMACRVFRLLKLGVIHDDPGTIRSSLVQKHTTLHFAHRASDTYASARADIEMAPGTLKP